MEKPKSNMAVDSSDAFPFPMIENLKHEKLDPPIPNMYAENTSTHRERSFQLSKEKTKRPYNKKQKITDPLSIEKPPPKKRGRKSKKELLMMTKKSEYAQEFQPTYKSPKIKSSSQPKSLKTKKTASTKLKKACGPAPGPSVFDKKILAGPHLTMKQVLEYILTDHSYCVPPDPLPAVGSIHQMIRYILGPKNGFKPRSLPSVGLIESGERSPISYSRTRTQLSMSSTPPPSSKLENLLKRGESSPMSASVLRFSHSRTVLDSRDESDVDIDVVSVDQEPEKRMAYDVNKAKKVMNECEKYVEFARNVDTGDDWECQIVRTGWTKQQSSMFDKVIGVLHTERLSRLTYMTAGDTEPVLRRTSLDKTTCRIRRIFGEYLWDTKLTQWLHSVLTEFLNFGYLAIYMDVLQSLKSQCPQLISRMMKLSIIVPLQSAYGRSNELQDLLTPYLEEESLQKPFGFASDELQFDTEKDLQGISTETCSGERHTQGNLEGTEIYLPAKSVVPQVEDAMMQLHSAKNAEAFKTLLERQWDPFSSDLMQKLKKLSANPVFLVIAPGVIFEKSSLNRRLKLYNRMFNRVGKVVKIRLGVRESLNCTSPFSYLEKIVSAAKEKLKDVRIFFPDRPLYVVGWGSGSLLAARLSVTVGPVDGIIALGFPLHSVRDMHDEALKIFGGIKHPILFVIGGLASNNSLTDMELFRRRLPCETSLVVVGSGNENLYVSRDHREKLLVTQSYVDKTVMDEVAYFVNLHSKHNQIIAANISMKPHHFSKSQTNPDVLNSKKSSLLRSKKRKSSCGELDTETYVANNNEDSKDSYDSEMEKSQEMSSAKSNFSRRDVDLNKSLGTFDYDFDGPKFVPSNKSSNKRKAHYRLDTSTNSSYTSSPSCITASKLLQQSPNMKRRISKPSGPCQRIPMLNQQPTQSGSTGGGQLTDIPKDDSAALLKYASAGTSQPDQDLSQSIGSNFPVVGQSVGQFQEGNHHMTKDVVFDKTSRKKSSSKSKGNRNPKPLTSESPTSSIVSGLSEVIPSPNTLSNSVPPSSLDMHKYVIQHQQMLRQFEQTQQERPQSSQLFKLLSPGTESSETVSVSSLPSTTTSTSGSQGASDLVKIKLIGTQTIVQSDIPGEGRTAVISKQNLLSNMSLPMIRLSRPTIEDSSQQQLFVTGASAPASSIIPNLSSDSSEKILLRTSDQSVMKINANELKTFLTGRPIQLITSGTNQTAVNIIVKKPQEIIETVTSNVKSNETAAVTTLPPTVNPSPTAPIVDTPKSLDPVENSKIAIDGPASNESKAEKPSVEPPGEPEPMDVDTEEEMSGLLISSTFSVCPTSGERVLPASCGGEPELVPGVEQSEPNSSSDMNSGEELLSVPIHVQVSNNIEQEDISIPSEHDITDDTVSSLGVTTEKNDEETQELQADQAAISTVQDSASTTDVSISECSEQESTETDSTALSQNLFLAVKSKPKELEMEISRTDEPNSNESPTNATSEIPAAESLTVTSETMPPASDLSIPECPSTRNDILTDIKVSKEVAKEESELHEEPQDDKTSDEKENSKVIAEEPDDTVSEEATSNVPELTSSVVTNNESPKKADSIDTINAAETSSICENNTADVQSFNETQGSQEATEVTKTQEMSLPEEQSLEKSENSEMKSTVSASSSDEDKRKSKSNPVRRSARLKSGV